MRLRKSKTPVRGIVEETLGGMDEYNKLIVNRSEIEFLKDAIQNEMNLLRSVLIDTSLEIINLKENEVTENNLQLSLQIYKTIVREYKAMKSFYNEVLETYTEINSVISRINSALTMEKKLKEIGEAVDTSLTGFSLEIPSELIARIYSLKEVSNLTMHSTKALVELRTEGTK